MMNEVNCIKITTKNQDVLVREVHKISNVLIKAKPSSNDFYSHFNLKKLSDRYNNALCLIEADGSPLQIGANGCSNCNYIGLFKFDFIEKKKNRGWL
ncbi:hypothetical protein [Vibrio metoecus]|uniref:hypothetical protein n=1 Tax=Vibrio metoecus TaxID=1481663 RepID=UPI0005116893|nr:hypothetical protein [Vibrio metoecus]